MGDLILQHGQAVLFIVSLIAQLGAPVPMTPLLLAAGALAKEGQLSFASVVAISMAASALGHLVWYEAGRRRGTAVLRLICRISLEPDSCVRRTEDFFGRHGGRALVAAPFVPGLGAVAPPLAGMAGMPVARFLLLDSLGALLWGARGDPLIYKRAREFSRDVVLFEEPPGFLERRLTVLVYVDVVVQVPLERGWISALLAGIGFVAGPELTALVQVGLRFGAWLGLAAGVVVGAWLGWKIAQRSAVARAVVVPRIEADDLRSRLGSSDPPLVVDLRSEMTRGEESIPGAHPVAPRELPRWAQGIPRDKEIVVACD